MSPPQPSSTTVPTITNAITDVNSGKRRFLGGPTPRQGPHVPYRNDAASNPILRGWMLAPLAIIIRSSTWIQSILWTLNNFNKLRDISSIEPYSPRYDPTVIPLAENGDGNDLLPVAKLNVRPRINDKGYYTCADYHALYKSGQLTPLQVAEYLVFLTYRPSGNVKAPDRFSVAFVSTRAELVLNAARASTERYAKGEWLGVLDGVPVAVKDEVEVAGYRRMLGSGIDFTGLGEAKETQTGWCVKKWIDAGAVIVGKTNMHEVGLDTNGFNYIWGTPLNPHNESYYTGGSSSGSACAVAQGVVPITLGADGGGSIRVPASFCGVYGLKTSHGRVSGRPTKDLANSVGVYGPLAGSLDDLALAYRVMAQPDPEDEKSSLFPNSLSTAVVKAGPVTSNKKTLGIDRAWVARSDPVVLSMFDAAVNHYSHTHGYTVIDISIPHLPENQKAHALTILSEVRAGLTPTQISQLSYQNQVLLSATGSQASSIDFLVAQRLRNMLMQHLACLWERYPGMLVLTPTTPCAGWKIGHPDDVKFRGFGASDSNMSLRSMEFVYLANWCGAPALSMPMGYTEDDDVPVGLMAMGEWGSEEQLLAWAEEGNQLVNGGTGIRRPRVDGCWLDVPVEAKKMNNVGG